MIIDVLAPAETPVAALIQGTRLADFAARDDLPEPLRRALAEVLDPDFEAPGTVSAFGSSL